MKPLTSKLMLGLAALVVASFVAAPVSATPGSVLKFSQTLGHFIDPTNDTLHGENIPSDVDWNQVMQPGPATGPLQPNWIIADDFRDPFDTGVFTVRWWGSYFEGIRGWFPRRDLL